MPSTVHVSLRAEGQGLSIVEAPPVMANGAIDRISFDLSLSDEWEGLGHCYVLLRRSGGLTRACKAIGGVAIADADALAGAGNVEVAVMAEGSGKRLTTERVILPLYESGI